MVQSTLRKPTAAAGSASHLSHVESELKAETNVGVRPHKVSRVNIALFCVRLQWLTMEEIMKYTCKEPSTIPVQMHSTKTLPTKVRSSSVSKKLKVMPPTSSPIPPVEPPITQLKTCKKSTTGQKRQKITGQPSELTTPTHFIFQMHQHVLQKRKIKVTLRC